jgi:hypothetical protein
MVGFAAFRLAGSGVETAPVTVELHQPPCWAVASAGSTDKGHGQGHGGTVIGKVQSVQVTRSVEELLAARGVLKAFPS